MNTKQNDQLNFTTLELDLKKTQIESNKLKHPSTYFIYLFNLGVLSDEIMFELENHLKYCIHCANTLNKALEMQEDLEKVEEDLVSLPTNIPSFHKFKESIFAQNVKLLEKNTSVKTSFASSLQQIADAIKNKLRHYAQLKFPDLQPQGGDSGGGNKTKFLLSYKNIDGKGMIVETKNELRIYTDITDLIGVTLSFGIGQNALAKCSFSKNRSRMDEGMIAMGVVDFVDVNDKQLRDFAEGFHHIELNNLKCEIISDLD